MEYILVYCNDCREENEIEIEEKELKRGLPRGERCPNPKCKSKNIEQV